MSLRREVTRTATWANVLFWLGFILLFAYSFHTIMDLGGLASPQRQKILLRVLAALSRPSIFDADTNRRVAAQMWETVQIGFLATTISGVFAAPLAYLIGRPSSSWGRAFTALVQTLLSVVHAVHPAIVTTFAIVIASIGPMAGVLALTLFTFAVLARDFSQFAQHHLSLSWPALLELYFPGLAFRRLPVTILTATILGFFGGGGIGFFLQQELSLLNYRDASVAILACVVTIASLDLLARALWGRIQNQRSAPTTPESADLH
jgi:phosphonate transport system permease protein